MDNVITTFYRRLLEQGRSGGMLIRQTGGQACLEFGIAEFTKDLDVLVAIQDLDRFFGLLESVLFQGVSCVYRVGHGAPLHKRWLSTGWTSHFTFPTNDPFLYAAIDVFGRAPRVLTPLEAEPSGLCASLNTVAEMKKTRRLKDWSIVTALGLKMLAAGDTRGLLHIYDADILARACKDHTPDESLRISRPVLGLALDESPLLFRAIQTERDFWQELDRRRLQIYKDAWVPYFRKVKDRPELKRLALRDQHVHLLQIAEQHLSRSPLGDYGIHRLFSETKSRILIGLSGELERFLPDTSALEDGMSVNRG